MFASAWWSLSRQPALPAGIRIRGPARVFRDATLLTDVTAWDPGRSERMIKQEIAASALAMIESAHTTIVGDFFLWNGWTGLETDVHRPLSKLFTEALAQRRRLEPDLDILILTDPINAAYATLPGRHTSPWWWADLDVVFTDLDRLRYSNRFYTAPFRLGRVVARSLPRLGAWLDRPMFANPFDSAAAPMSVAQAARLLRFKANHRKVLICDDAEGRWHVLVASLNPHDGSSAHANIGIRIDGPVALDAARSELDVFEWSLASIPSARKRARMAAVIARVRGRMEAVEPSPPLPDAGPARARWLTEGAIRDSMLDRLAACGDGSTIRLAMFYLSQRGVITALKDAARRGAEVRIILDPNKDAFGRAKHGIPNRAVAFELMRFAGRHELPLHVRWADTHGEQFHGKTLAVSERQEASYLLCGSANYTRRNLDDLNMEAAIEIRGDDHLHETFAHRFDAWWDTSSGEPRVTVPYARYALSWWRAIGHTVLYRFGEWSGLSTY